MPKLPKGVQSLEDVARKRGKGGQILKHMRAATKSSGTPITPKTEVKSSKLLSGVKAIKDTKQYSTGKVLVQEIGRGETMKRAVSKSKGAEAKATRIRARKAGKLPKGVTSLGGVARGRGKGGRMLKTMRRSPLSFDAEGISAAAERRGRRAFLASHPEQLKAPGSPAQRKVVERVAPARTEEVHRGVKMEKQIIKGKAETAKAKRLQGARAGKLPKGVSTIEQAATARGKGGQILRSRKAERGMGLETQETPKRERLSRAAYKSVRAEATFEARGQAAQRSIKTTHELEKPVTAKTPRLKALGVAGAAANIGGYVRAHKSLKKSKPKTRTEGMARVARELGFVIPKGKRPGGL
jgi:hypothetical protein